MTRNKIVYAALLIVLPASSSAPPPSGSEVVVHLIDARTGKPLPRKPMQLFPVYNPVRPAETKLARTDAAGVATFHLDEPLPSTVIIHTGMGGYWEECFPQEGPYDLNEILTSGVSRMGGCLFNIPNVDQKFHPKPGEVYFFVVHLSFLEHLTHCGEWGCKGSPEPVASSAAAEPSRYNIMILMADGRTGELITRKPLMVYTVLAKPDPQTGAPYKPTELETDANGKAVYGFDDPALNLLVHLAAKGSRPCSAERVNPDEVLQHGVVAPNDCDPSGAVRAKFTPKPGELVFFSQVR